MLVGLGTLLKPSRVARKLSSDLLISLLSVLCDEGKWLDTFANMNEWRLSSLYHLVQMYLLEIQKYLFVV